MAKELIIEYEAMGGNELPEAEQYKHAENRECEE